MSLNLPKQKKTRYLCMRFLHHTNDLVLGQATTTVFTRFFALYRSLKQPNTKAFERQAMDSIFTIWEAQT